MSAPEHRPGSPEAVAQGCTCSPALNHNGEGIPVRAADTIKPNCNARCMGGRWRSGHLRAARLMMRTMRKSSQPDTEERAAPEQRLYYPAYQHTGKAKGL